MQAEETQAVGKIPSGLFIVVSNAGRPDGFLGSFIQQVSMKPLLISLAITPGRPAYDSIMAGDVFSINIVGEHDKTYLKHFWKGYDPDNSPFDELECADGANGALILKQALGSIECRKVQSLKPGDHELVIAEVLSSVLHTKGKPVTHVRKDGLSYS